MAKVIVASLIIGAAIIGAVALYIYNTPYQTCLRMVTQSEKATIGAVIMLCGSKDY